MKRLLLSAAIAAALLACWQGESQAQYVTYYSPVAAPTPVVYYRPVARPVAAPVYAAPAPVAYTVARPVVAAPVVAPVAYTRTRWRPFLGGTVTRVRYGYAPVGYYGY